MSNEQKRQELLAQGYVKVGSKTYLEYWKKGEEVITLNIDEEVNMKQGLIEFDGHTITYPNGNKIYINCDDYSYTFDVADSTGNELGSDMWVLEQAHKVALGDLQ
jgi:hypothetical protein